MTRYTAKTFPAFIAKCKARQRAVIQTSVQRLAEAAQLQGPSKKNPGGGKGGRMPIDQSFLRSSFTGALGGMPTGPSEPSGSVLDWDQSSITLVIAGWEPGTALYLGWTAKYARKMEELYGFMKGAADQWQQINDDAVREVRARIP